MKRISRLMLIAAITLLVLSSACNLPALPAATPSAIPSEAELASSTPIAIATSSATPAPAIPITGLDVVSLQCQFCVNDETHAVLIMSSQAFFNVADPTSGVTCLSAREMDGRRILLCRGAQQASFTLNVCVDTANCLQFPITLQPCPLIQATGTGTAAVLPTFTPAAPVILTPRNTLVPPTSPASTPVPTNTSETPPAPTATDIVPTQPTTEPPSPTEPSTVEPPAPTATSAQTGSGGGGGEGNKVVICHVSPSNPDERTTITVSRSSWENEHSQHGDSLGAC